MMKACHKILFSFFAVFMLNTGPLHRARKFHEPGYPERFAGGKGAIEILL